MKVYLFGKMVRVDFDKSYCVVMRSSAAHHMARLITREGAHNIDGILITVEPLNGGWSISFPGRLVLFTEDEMNGFVRNLRDVAAACGAPEMVRDAVRTRLNLSFNKVER